MKRIAPRSLLVLAMSGIHFGILSSFSQGPLTPKTGPVPTMKTLGQIEPRIDLQNAPDAAVTTTDTNYQYIITQPGSYYLSGNLVVLRANGVQINAEGVTLDLNGFQISSNVGSNGNGIEIAMTSHRAVIRNGSLQGFGNGIQSNSILGEYPRACAFRNLSVSGCTSTGIRAGGGAVLESCRAHDTSGQFGIATGTGSSLSNCTANNNTASYGIFAGPGSSLINCSAAQNTGSSIDSAGILTGWGCTITHCTASFNNSTATPLTTSTGMGFSVASRSTIYGCTAASNFGDGIKLVSNSVARDNCCYGNGTAGDGAGVHVSDSNNRIEGNNVTSNDRGIDVDFPGNIIIKNTAADNPGNNYSIVADNVFGAIVGRANPGSAAVSGSNAPSSAGTLDPWANFGY